MLVAVCADKGSPGSTTTALALAAAWPTRAVVVEADPYGGDLLARVSLKGEVLSDSETVLSVVTAASARRDEHGRIRPASGELVDRYAQPLNDQVGVVPGPLMAELASSVSSWPVLAEVLAASSTPVVVDLGRIHTAAPSLPVAAAADALVVVCRGESESVDRMLARVSRLVPKLADLRGRPPRIVPVVITRRRWGSGAAEDVARLLSDTPAAPFIASVGWLALDPTAVRRLHAGEDPSGKLARSGLLKSAATITDALGAPRTHAALTPAPTPTTSAEASDVTQSPISPWIEAGRRVQAERSASAAGEGSTDG